MAVFFTLKRKLENIEQNNNFDFIKISLFIMLISFIRKFQIDNLTEPNQLLTPLTCTDDKNAAAAAFQSLSKPRKLLGMIYKTII